MKIKSLFALLALALLITACAQSPVPAVPPEQAATVFNNMPTGDAIEFNDTKATIEYNATAGDLGFHVELVGKPFKHVWVFGPDGTQLFEVKAEKSIGTQGLTSFNFESAEPPLEELPKDEFLARFPEGEYTFVGETIDGVRMEGVSDFNHKIPDPAVIVSPVEGASIPLGDVVVDWEPVTTPANIEIEAYQFQIFPVDPPEGQDPIGMNIDLLFEAPADVTRVSIPAEYLVAGEIYQYEVVAFNVNGNRSITVGTFIIE